MKRVQCRTILASAALLPLWAAGLPAQTTAPRTVVVRPKEIDDVLVNPGIGFMTFGEGARRGNPARPASRRAQPGKDYPQTSMDYLRIYWNDFEPERGKYRWVLIDGSLKAAHDRGQTLMFRIMPYGDGETNDVPGWYRAMVGEEPERKLPARVRTNPDDPRYVQYFGGMVREIGARYDGHPDLESVDVSIIGPWGEGAGSAQLIEPTREALVDCYLESFHKTPLIMLLTDARTNKYGLSKQNVGWRVDCLGDMFGFGPNWNHMYDYYPEGIINFGMRDAWQKAPVTFEACWVMGTWKEKGWDIDYIIDQSLKWHISSFNAKSSPVPEQWRAQVSRWLNRMGYRFVLRKFTYPATVRPSGKLAFTTWWENKGVAPCYRRFPLALRLKGGDRAAVLVTEADIRTWLPGDALYDDAVFVPADIQPGEYEIQIAMLDPARQAPKIKLAIEGGQPDGWYTLGRIRVE